LFAGEDLNLLNVQVKD